MSNISQNNSLLSRRYFLSDCQIGLGKIALAGLLTNAWTASSTRRANAAAPSDGLAPAPHFRGQAKHVIHLFMGGGPSHLEMFDNHPELKRWEGQSLPASVLGNQRFAFIKPTAAVLGPQFNFSRHGQCGTELSEVLPHLAQIVDDICVVKSVHTEQFNHAPAQIMFNTGFGQPGRPSIGAWVQYALGTESDNLPAYVVMLTTKATSGGTALWSSGFLPTIHTGVRLRAQKDPILHISNPPGVSNELQQDTYNVVSQLNRKQLERLGDPEISTRISQYEMASRLQVSAPDLMNLNDESAETLAMYGCDPNTPSFARSCLLARRMIERGVRFVSLFHEGWDHHGDVANGVREACRATDQASAALVADLKQRGLLNETLVVWGGEFGRTPMVEVKGKDPGRDHHPQAFSMWMAGGGIRGGTTIGQTDDFGFRVTENPVHVHDIQATLLHCLGLNHERLTYFHAGRDFRLTDVHGRVVQEMLS
ncbi:MAG: DUF1501 domain-containing protein [Planctomycetota bacterium]|nr:DUF1501 domain-containing protein [Planctomycetota bacterium]MDA1178816.1 DUF1501 domain-containing protein [Planctomycetota bacterium]